MTSSSFLPAVKSNPLPSEFLGTAAPQAIRQQDQSVKIIMSLRYFIKENQYFVQLLERTNRPDSAKKIYVDPIIAFQWIKPPAMIYSALKPRLDEDKSRSEMNSA